MRVTKARKEETRRCILTAAADLFAARGYEAATTRDISVAAGIATGTLFNYFKTKEEIVLAMVQQAFDDGRETVHRRSHGDEDLDEKLFAHVAAALRRLRPHREYLYPALDGATVAGPRSAAARLRDAHLALVRENMEAHGWADAATDVTLHLYWALLNGILSFWARDRSPRQEMTLALIDRSMRLFVQSLSFMGGMPRPEGSEV